MTPLVLENDILSGKSKKKLKTIVHSLQDTDCCCDGSSYRSDHEDNVKIDMDTPLWSQFFRHQS